MDNNKNYFISIGKEDYEHSWYYIQPISDVKLKCVVDCYCDLTNYFADNIYRQIVRQEIIGVKLKGYAIFVYPCRETRQSGEIIIDTSILPQIEFMANYFLETVIRSCPQKFEKYIAEDNIINLDGELGIERKKEETNDTTSKSVKWYLKPKFIIGAIVISLLIAACILWWNVVYTILIVIGGFPFFIIMFFAYADDLFFHRDKK